MILGSLKLNSLVVLFHSLALKRPAHPLLRFSEKMLMNVVFAFKDLYLLNKRLEDEVESAGEKSTREEDVVL